MTVTSVVFEYLVGFTEEVGTGSRAVMYISLGMTLSYRAFNAEGRVVVVAE